MVSKMVGMKTKSLENIMFSKDLRQCGGGEGGIRTLEGLTPLTVFETAPFNHSGTSPASQKNRAGRPGVGDGRNLENSGVDCKPLVAAGVDRSSLFTMFPASLQ